jgi:glycosyltransferase involved in cell wall biosynthesis
MPNNKMPEEDGQNAKSENFPELSAVVLCYRAGEEIKDVVKIIKKVFEENSIFDYELILVGNYIEGTGDPTPRIVEEISRQDEKINFVALPKEGMMGWDMKSGLEKAKGRYIAVIDGDGQMPFIDLARVYQEIKISGADLVKTYRLRRGDGFKRKILSSFYNIFFAILFPGLDSRDINSKPKIMTEEFCKNLKLESDGWFIDAEIMIKARRLKAMIKEIPTDFLGLTGKRKSFVRLSAIREFIINLAIYRIKEFFK